MNQFPIAEKTSKGPTFGIIIIVLLIIIGGIYILTSRSNETSPAGDTPPIDSPAGGSGYGETVTPAPVAPAPQDVSDLEAEAEALETDLGTLDQEAAQ